MTLGRLSRQTHTYNLSNGKVSYYQQPNIFLSVYRIHRNLGMGAV